MPRTTLVAPLLVSILLAGCNRDRVLDGPAGSSHLYSVVEIARGLEHPWAMAFLPDGDILVTERPGRVRLVHDGALVPTPVAGAPSVRTGGQGGLLDIALHPQFEDTRLVYLSYSKAVDGSVTTAVARARWEDGALTGLEDVFVALPAMGTGRHFGSRLLFDRDGYLWITVGDMGLGDPARDPSNHAGTTIRLHDDGRVPSDNPFVGDPQARPEVFSYGHRNAQGLALHPETGEVWLHEHGPRGGDAVQLVRPGANYGWPDVSFGRQYSMLPIPDPEPGQGIELPLHHWTPSIAPSGMAFYTGDHFPNWRGDVFAGALAGQHLRRVVFDGTDPVHEEQLLADYGARIRDVRMGPDGYLYFLTDSNDGALGRLEPSP
jgi:aldose sugar dehydrogenase